MGAVYKTFDLKLDRLVAIGIPRRGKIFQPRATPSERTCQDENRAFLKEYGVEYDERYVWD
jgi:hypothetical protein